MLPARKVREIEERKRAIVARCDALRTQCADLCSRVEQRARAAESRVLTRTVSGRVLPGLLGGGLVLFQIWMLQARRKKRRGVCVLTH